MTTVATVVALIEDNPGDVRLIQEMLREPPFTPFQMSALSRLDDGLEHLRQQPCEVLLLDLGLPDSNGLDTFQRVKARSPRLPVIIFSGAHDEELAAEAVAQGAQDYLVKGQVDSFLLKRAIRYAIERKRAEEMLRRTETELHDQEQLFRLLLDSTGEGIYGLDVHGICTFCNPAAAQFLGYGSPEELMGKSMHSLIHHTRADGTPYPAEHCPIYTGIRLGTRSNRDDEVFWRADGTSFSAEYQSYPIRQGGEILGSVVTFVNVTQRKSLEQQLRQAQKMEAVGQLAGGVAHDFNNLLTVVKSYGALLLDEVPVADARHESVAEIVSAADRAATLTRQLLAFSRQQVLNPHPLNLNQVVSEMEKMLRRLITEHIDFRLHLAPNLGTVTADASQLEQVLANLIVNARDAMPDGGRLTLTTQNVDAMDARTSLPSADPAPHVLLTVADSGIGMDEPTVRRIFEPFFTTKERGRGTGLGLSTVHGIIKQSGGHIRVSSVPGHGTTFEIYLPQVAGEAEHRVTPTAVVQESTGTEQIMLVEDDVAVRRVIVRVLKGLGYTVIEASNGPEALAKARLLPETVDLLVTDLVMPGMNGRDLATALRLHWPALRVLFISGYSEEVAADRRVLGGEGLFMEKPFLPAQLAAKVREALAVNP